MILCKECGYEGVYEGRLCPQCRAAFSLSADDIAKIEEDYRLALSDGAYESAAELAHILADAGKPAAAAAYGRMLYEGDGVAENVRAAMEYLSFSAKEGDALGAFLYGKALSERGDAAGDFFLLYAALLGHGQAYVPAAEIFFSIGRESDGAAYLALAAKEGDRTAALSLARRMEKKDPAIAKWYLSAAAPLPPHAWPLSLRLRRIEPKEPPLPALPHVGALIAELRVEAEKRGLKKLYLNLTQMLATRGDKAAQCRLGALYLEGYLGASDPKRAREVLLYYGKGGNADAYLFLGDAYLSGEHLPVSRAGAIECFHAAKALGAAAACVRLGDMYTAEESPNVAYAYLMYKEALALGSREGADKARAIEEKRESLYMQGKAYLPNDGEDAYRSFALSASMGYAPAAVALGFCYEEGLGVAMDRRRAFLWYERAAKEQETMALYRLGRAYFYGIGINRNFAEAHKLLRRAAAQGIEDARKDLFEMLERRRKKMLRSLYSLGMRLLYQGKYEAARSMIERASALGLPRATYVLGCFYEFGVGGAVMRDLAFATYHEAQAQGFADTRARYKSVILKMLHLKNQKSEAAAR
ncbi:MAG: sel1 repeat family protein [Clostridia bacterium]|nr:sel1 repeat family protein [Clostridia bacterium]